MIGIVSISFRGNSVDEIIKYAKECGLSCIEWGSDVHAPYNDFDNLHYIKEQCNKYNIDCCSYGSYFEIGTNKSEEIRDYIKAAKILGTNIIRIWGGNKAPNEFTSNEKYEFFEECRKLVEIAEKEGAVLCLECHNNTITQDLESALELMKKINSPAFKMYWQPNQFKTFSENIEYAKAIAPYTNIIHVFNWEGENHYPLAEGKEQWIEYFKYFDSIPALLEFMPDDKISSLEKESKALREIMEGIR